MVVSVYGNQSCLEQRLADHSLSILGQPFPTNCLGIEFGQEKFGPHTYTSGKAAPGEQLIPSRFVHKLAHKPKQTAR